MKKLLKVTIVSIILLSILSITTFADMGSKPKVTIKIENPPKELYYLDLLYTPKSSLSNIYSYKDRANYNIQMFDLLFSYTQDNWYPALAYGTIVPVMGELTPDNNGVHTINYLGVPDEFKIIIVTQDGTVKTSPLIQRKTMEVELVLDYDTMAYTKASTIYIYLKQFLATCLITFLIEGVILILFKLATLNNIKYIIATNIFTQIVFTVIFSSAFIYGGTLGAFFVFIPLEIAVVICEAIIYKKLLVGKEKSITLYTITANLASALATFFSLSTLLMWLSNAL